MEDGNRVTKVKYAGILVVHWTKPLLRQHRCPRESSGPYGRYALRRTRYRVSLFKRGNGMRIEGRVKIFLQFFLFIYAKKKRKKEKEKDGNIFDRERKIYFLIKEKKKLKFLKLKFLSTRCQTNSTSRIYFSRVKFLILFSLIYRFREFRSNKQRCFSSNFSREGNRKIKKNPDRVYFEIFLLRFFSRSQNTVIKTVSASVRSLLLSFTFIIKCINILRKCYFSSNFEEEKERSISYEYLFTNL